MRAGRLAAAAARPGGQGVDQEARESESQEQQRDQEARPRYRFLTILARLGENHREAEERELAEWVAEHGTAAAVDQEARESVALKLDEMD